MPLSSVRIHRYGACDNRHWHAHTCCRPCQRYRRSKRWMLSDPMLWPPTQSRGSVACHRCVSAVCARARAWYSCSFEHASSSCSNASSMRCWCVLDIFACSKYRWCRASRPLPNWMARSGRSAACAGDYPREVLPPLTYRCRMID
eukprot:COSAG02_NODE_5210_length_4540_cov_2.660662_7_plen_145_part_00